MKTEAGNCHGRLKRVTNNSKENAQIIKTCILLSKSKCKTKEFIPSFFTYITVPFTLNSMNATTNPHNGPLQGIEHTGI
jgi:hypothetical protein